MIYFIQQGKSGPIKIGWTTAKDFDSRLRSIQCSNPERLYCIGTVKSLLFQDEAKLHRKFHDCQIRGEWFSPSKRLVQYIRKNSDALVKR